MLSAESGRAPNGPRLRLVTRTLAHRSGHRLGPCKVRMALTRPVGNKGAPLQNMTMDGNRTAGLFEYEYGSQVRALASWRREGLTDFSGDTPRAWWRWAHGSLR